MNKDGLESAVDFTKLIITIDSGLIAFTTGAAFLAHITTLLEKGGAGLALLLLAISLAAGVVTCMRAATMLGEENYDLGDRHLKIPGMVNVVAFAAGAIALGGMAAYTLIAKDIAPSPEAPVVKVLCQTKP